MFTKKQVQALRVLKKISTYTISQNIHFDFVTPISDDVSGSIFFKKTCFFETLH